MDREIRISVLMGVYNCAATLPAALDSLLTQTYGGFRVIVCDDGSTDDTGLIVADYCRRNPDRFIAIANDRNMGLNIALNRCLELTDTEFCARMDGDDISLPGRFEQQIEFLDAHPEYAIVGTPMIFYDENGVFRRDSGGYEPRPEICAIGTPFCHPTAMVRTSAYRAVGGYGVGHELLRVEDYDLWIRMFVLGLRGYVLKEPLYMFNDGAAAYDRRTYSVRLRSSRIQRRAVRTFNMPRWKYVYSLRTLIVGLLPRGLYMKLHRRTPRRRR